MPSFHHPLLKSLANLVRLSHLADQLNVSVDVLKDLHSRRNDTVSRREMLRVAFHGAALIPASQFLKADPWRKFTTPRNRKLSPVIVLGGGMAGLTTAYRLHLAGVPTQVFEGSNRWGGRIFTQEKFNSENMFWERGGELIDSNHSALISLATELDLHVEDITGQDHGLIPLTYSLRDRTLSEKQIQTGLTQLARALRPDLDRISTYGPTWRPTLLDAAQPQVVRLDRLSIAEYLKTFDLETWVKDLLCSLYVSEFGLEAEQQSALNLLTMITLHGDLPSLLGESDESKRIRGGNDQLPKALVQKLATQIPMHPGHELVKISDSGRNFKLTFTRLGQSSVEIEAERVVCTLPFTKLREIQGIYDLDLKPEKKLSIRTLGFGTCSKIGLGFQSRPWRNLPKGLQKGASGILLSDTDQYIWESSRLQKGNQGILTNLIGGKAGAHIETTKVESLINTLERAFPGCQNHFQKQNVSVQHWPTNPWTRGSYTCHLPGQYTTIRGAAGATELRGRLHFAGEHTSLEFEGFMNGAVETANQVAQRLLKESIRPYPDAAHSASGT